MVWKKKAAEFQAEQDLRFDTWVNKWGKPEEQAKWKAEKKAGKVKLPTGKRKKADVSESESEEVSSPPHPTPVLRLRAILLRKNYPH